MGIPASKIDRLHLRLSPSQKEKLARAARARHLNTSQFVLQSALDTAETVLEQEQVRPEQAVFLLKPEAWEMFNRRLDAPARVLPELQKLFAEPDYFVDGDTKDVS